MKKKTKVLSFLATGLGLTAIIGGTVGGIMSNQATSNVAASELSNNSFINENSKPQLPSSNETTNGVETNKPQLPNQNEVTNDVVTNKPSSNNGSINNDIVDGVQTPSTEVVQEEGKLFSSVLAKTEASTESTQEKPSHTIPGRITREFNHGWIEEDEMLWGKVIGTTKKHQSDLYYNQRDFMPIVSSYEQFYSNERSLMEVSSDIYNGWNKEFSTKWWEGGVVQTKYVATPAVLTKLGSGSISEKGVNSLKIDFSNQYFQKMGNKSDVINEYIKDAANKGINFFIIENASQNDLEKIVIPTNKDIGKVTIKDFNGKLTSLKGITIPESVKELEFYSTTASKIDPTILSSKTHMIYDHIDGTHTNLGELKFKVFKTIDLSNRSNLTNEDLQKALDTVYGERQYERAFHGDFIGGYIYQLDLTGTPIKSLNNVYIPSQSDGRFNIAYVQWTSGVNSHGTVSIQIGTNKYPGNDAQVNEWYDASGWAEKATKIMLNTTGKMDIKDIVNEVKPLFKKYPNVTVLDLTDVHLKDGQSYKELAEQIIEVWNNIHTGENSVAPTLEIIHPSVHDNN